MPGRGKPTIKFRPIPNYIELNPELPGAQTQFGQEEWKYIFKQVLASQTKGNVKIGTLMRGISAEMKKKGMGMDKLVDEIRRHKSEMDTEIQQNLEWSRSSGPCTRSRSRQQKQTQSTPLTIKNIGNQLDSNRTPLTPSTPANQTPFTLSKATTNNRDSPQRYVQTGHNNKKRARVNPSPPETTYMQMVQSSQSTAPPEIAKLSQGRCDSNGNEIQSNQRIHIPSTIPNAAIPKSIDSKIGEIKDDLLKIKMDAAAYNSATAVALQQQTTDLKRIENKVDAVQSERNRIIEIERKVAKLIQMATEIDNSISRSRHPPEQKDNALSPDRMSFSDEDSDQNLRSPLNNGHSQIDNGSNDVVDQETSWFQLFEAAEDIGAEKSLFEGWGEYDVLDPAVRERTLFIGLPAVKKKDLTQRQRDGFMIKNMVYSGVTLDNLQSIGFDPDGKPIPDIKVIKCGDGSMWQITFRNNRYINMGLFTELLNSPVRPEHQHLVKSGVLVDGLIARPWLNVDDRVKLREKAEAEAIQRQKERALEAKKLDEAARRSNNGKYRGSSGKRQSPRSKKQKRSTPKQQNKRGSRKGGAGRGRGPAKSSK